jgi:hypothetical protein
VAIHKTLRLRHFLIGLLAMVGLAGAVLGGGIWYINSSDRLERWIETKLSNPDNQIMVRVADASISLSLSSHPIMINTCRGEYICSGTDDCAARSTVHFWCS